jgi:hypothetical protein
VKVTLLPELFDAPVYHSLLISILSYPLNDRHRIELDLKDPGIANWLSTQSRGLQEEIQFALDLSTQAEVLEPSSTAVHIRRSVPTEFGSVPLRIHIDEARRFLDSPFVLLVEDEVSDGAFLRRMLTDEERRFFDQRIQSGFVRIDHGGGITAMARRVAADAAVPMNWHTLWVLFDSDAMQPGVPSTASETLRAACSHIKHHQLRRRYAESYLTTEALHGWATSQAKRTVRDERLEVLRAFIGMSDDQRHHYNMKDGFNKDASRTDANAGQLYANVSEQDRRKLADGFDEHIADLFSNGSVTEADLRRGSGWAELRPVFLNFLGRIR